MKSSAISSKLIAIAIPTLTAFTVAMLISLTRWPVPQMHDDFSNLLAADTLLHGRLANPTPPAFESMETFHVVMTPTYASKFPLGPAFFLAIGKLVMGDFACGLWLCCALATASITWMLLACFPNRWASGMGLCIAVHPSWQNGWAQEFTHGWLPLAGVALVLGGTLRLHRILRMTATSLETTNPQAYRFSLLGIAIGCSLVLFSRPFDGGIVCLMLMASLTPSALRWLSSVSQTSLDFRILLFQSTLPAVGVILIAIGLQLATNKMVTGQLQQLPYQLHEKQYGVAPLFIWGTPNEPTIGHRFVELSTYHQKYSLNSWSDSRSLGGYTSLLANRGSQIIQHWGCCFAILPMAILTWRTGRRRWGSLLVIALVAILTINCVPWVMPAYVASLIPIAILLFSFILKRFSTWIASQYQFQSTLPSSRRRAEFLTLGFLFCFQLIALSYTCYARATNQSGWQIDWANERQRMVNRLKESDESHLILVEYQSDHNVNEEWVYNEADIPNAKIVWGRFASPELNQQLVKSYPNRKVWRLPVP
ncbi:MAG: hypothetical protein ACOVQM_01410, partial [Pirellula sp.]